MRDTDIPFDVHIMTLEPQKFISMFAEAGADILVPASLVSKDSFTQVFPWLKSLKGLTTS